MAIFVEQRAVLLCSLRAEQTSRSERHVDNPAFKITDALRALRAGMVHEHGTRSAASRTGGYTKLLDAQHGDGASVLLVANAVPGRTRPAFGSVAGPS